MVLRLGVGAAQVKGRASAWAGSASMPREATQAMSAAVVPATSTWRPRAFAAAAISGAPDPTRVRVPASIAAASSTGTWLGGTTMPSVMLMA